MTTITNGLAVLVSAATIYMPGTTLDGGVFDIEPAFEWTGGGLVTNSRDLALWAKALYDGHAIPGTYLDHPRFVWVGVETSA